ncbi:tagaturonate reductase [Cohnella sp. JJ-181]|uniref:tagaturonate reductase n=1 Tax=Cohnella rhizoplanae TaxID=2974897 RepID=UPI0022FFB9DA|nr:tagaturonate reductase [Cohnella sp. JJ-181]CAI6077201.1 Altronate oxidoreductase [Cohnella sp. JJ-181]
MNPLSGKVLMSGERASFEAARQSPVTVLQVGEGNFLRGFFDWMIHRCREQNLFSGGIAVTQPRPSGKAKMETLAAQEGLYTLVTRGLDQGEIVQRKEIVSVFSEVVDPYSEWPRFGELARSPSLRFVVSNTTEAGLAYRPEPLAEGRPIQSFPGKMTWLLYQRYLALGARADSGLIFLPCELVARNGDELKRCVLRYAEDWSLPAPFLSWVTGHNRFLNSLVDRIVTGHPGEAAAGAWFAEWGYTDAMLNTAEPYHLWAIEAEPGLDRELPLRQAGLNVHWVDDLEPYQLRKVRILNGAHTLMAPLALLSGVTYVREAMEHARFGPFVREAVEQEIIPAVGLPPEALLTYAATVYERFMNPFIDHRLSDIAMNSLSKFKTRLLPTLLYYASGGMPLPSRIVEALAGLLRYYRVRRDEEGFVGRTLAGMPCRVRDDEASLASIAAAWDGEKPLHAKIADLLGLDGIWGQDLSGIEGLASSIAALISVWEAGESDE